MTPNAMTPSATIPSAITPAAMTAAPIVCSPAGRVTRSLLGYGVIAGPVYVVSSLTDALTRPGFDLRRHSWSLLSNGSLGWLHIATFLLTGAMVVAGAAGLARALPTGVGSTWVPRLTGGYGLSLMAAGVLRADPALGFPIGTPAGPGTVSWHGAGHLVAGAIGFACLIAACLILARRLWPVFSRVTGLGFLVAFVGIASTGGNAAFNLAFTAAVVLAWAWLSAVCVHLYRTVA